MGHLRCSARLRSRSWCCCARPPACSDRTLVRMHSDFAGDRSARPRPPSSRRSRPARLDWCAQPGSRRTRSGCVETGTARPTPGPSQPAPRSIVPEAAPDRPAVRRGLGHDCARRRTQSRMHPRWASARSAWLDRHPFESVARSVARGFVGCSTAGSTGSSRLVTWAWRKRSRARARAQARGRRGSIASSPA